MGVTPRGVVGITTFINPYTFVPLPDQGPQRAAPHGHAGTTPGLLSARLHVTITAQAPLLLRGFGTPDAPALPDRPGPRGGRVTMLPGSGLHGAIRSLHEALTNSCLRVVDDEAVPTYRQQPDVDEIARLRLAVVTQAQTPAGTEAPPTVRLCEEIPAAQWRRHRLDMGVLQRLHHDLASTGGLRSGQRLTVVFPDNPDNPHQQPEDATPDPDGDWVVFISDAGARNPQHAYNAAIRHLSFQTRTVAAPAWSDFLRAVDLADDLRPERLRQVPESRRWAEVVHATHTVGMRSLARRTVHVGQPLWVRLNEAGEIAQVRLSQIWREPGTISVGERIGEHQPCVDPDRLCPSCRLFGSADVSGAADGPTQQRSYRGHVRFSDALAITEVTPTAVTLPPMGRPRPGAGQFYLDNPEEVIGNAAPGIPLREWGSRADSIPGRGPRRIRGRKFYWHTVPPVDQLPARGRARPAQGDAGRSTPAVLFPAGTMFTATITAIDVDVEQLGSLLAALDPATVLGQPDALVSLGGGRPLGYGSCRIVLDEAASQVWTSASRYSADSRASTAELITRSRAAFATLGATPDSPYGPTWQALAVALSASAVDGDKVWYPPGLGHQGSATYDVGFPFWKQTAGKELERRNGQRAGHPLTPLPHITDNDQTMKVIATAAPEVLPNQRPVS
jgi:CRISPR-associated protein (TIGR03986 family)